MDHKFKYHRNFHIIKRYIIFIEERKTPYAIPTDGRAFLGENRLWHCHKGKQRKIGRVPVVILFQPESRMESIREAEHKHRQ